MSGWLLCKIHGGQHPFHTCIHVLSALSSSSKIEVCQSPLFGAKICTDCYNLYSGTDLEGLTFDSLFLKDELVHNQLFDLYEKIDIQIPRTILCPKCIDEDLVILKCR